LCVAFSLVTLTGRVQYSIAQGLVPSTSGIWYQDTTPLPSPSPIDPKNTSEVINWHLKEAEKGNSDSQVRIALIYLTGDGVSVNKAEGIRWLEKASLNGNPEADNLLASLFFSDPTLFQGSQVMKCRDDALRFLEKSAKKGYPDGELNYGIALFDGNEKNGIYWMAQAAMHGNKIAKTRLMSLKPKNPDNQAFIYRSAIDWGDHMAEFQLGICYLLGDGVPKDPAHGYQLITKAAESGIPIAQCRLGLAYQSGDQIEVNHSEAIRWLIKSADQGVGEAYNALGNALWQGEGVEVNPANALAKYFMAASKGVPSAFCSIGKAYEQGIGIEQNLNEALKWYGLGVSHGSTLAETYLSELKKTMQEAESQKQHPSSIH